MTKGSVPLSRWVLFWAIALGGAYTALASDANALRYNPAGLAQARRYEASAMHDQYFQGATHEYFSLAAPGGWGASLTFLASHAD